ncbi:Pyruvate formate-lyase 1-activating enzyme [compost metagenome]|uniref:4Fe-4S single cluster domain-containing protein n=1 Tax=Paenibacillus sp. J53TS2 TaxID=2807197 RepID=UPI000FBFE7FE|nr:4Fe-4S single cluster domain-containing protein [Paenibacillus sp. J53TS2]GIP47738.1 radical SAM protein [Paenibacillus sp. J53TS2]
MTAKIFVHEVSRASLVNGPGTRAVVWVQGCSIGCPGCFNPETHAAHSDSDGGSDPEELGKSLGHLAVDGLTVSGGEPLEQPEAVAALIEAFRKVNPGTVLIFSGLSPKRIFASPEARQTILLTDAVLAGPYVEGDRSSGIWSGKQLILVTDRIYPEELTPEKRLEVSLQSSGQLRLSGYPGLMERELFSKLMKVGFQDDDKG